MPLMIHGAQVCAAFRRDGDRLVSDSIVEGGFMALRGSSGRPNITFLPLGERGTLVAEFPALPVPPVSGARLHKWLHGPSSATATDVTVDDRDALFRADHWLALHDSSYCRLRAHGDDAERELLPPLPAPATAAPWPIAYGCGLVDGSGAALLAVADLDVPEPAPLVVRTYGAADALAARLVAHLEAWRAAGGGAALPRRITILPRGAATPAGASVLTRRESVVVVD
jgi:hypothetical protein